MCMEKNDYVDIDNIFEYVFCDENTNVHMVPSVSSIASNLLASGLDVVLLCFSIEAKVRMKEVKD